MGNFVGGFLGNDSPFGRVMNVFYIIIVSNLLFVVFSLPMVTTGAAYTALYHVALKAMRNDGEVSPAKEFFKGFKSNFKQSTLVWIALCLVAFFLYGDMRIIAASGGSLEFLKYAAYAIGIAAAFGAAYIFPVIAAFRNTISGLIATAYYFAVKNPIRTVVMIGIHAFFAFWIYVDAERRPIFAFCFFFFGFAAIVAVCALMILKDFSKILDRDKEKEAPSGESGEDGLS